MLTGNRRRHLFCAGILLFLLALVTGMIMPWLPNMRMGLSAHLVGLLGGLFLIGLGALWGEQNLSERPAMAVCWLAIYGTYGNLVTGVLSATFKTARLTPLAGANHLAEPWQENIVTFGLVSSSVAMVLVCVLVLWGLRNPVASRVE